MKIAFVSSGRSIHVKKLANGLVKHGHEVTLYTLPDHTKLLNEFDRKVKIEILKFGGKIGYYLNAPILRKKLQNGNYDVINCHYVSGYGTLTRLANVKPIVASVFGSDVYDYPFKSKLNMKRVIKNLNSANVITSTSQVMINKVREYYITEKPMYVTHFGVDTNIFKPNISANEKDSYTKEKFVFGIIKKLENKYGINVLIEAFSIFLNTLDDSSKCMLYIYGTGTQEMAYKKRVLDLKLQDNVVFKGYIENSLVPLALNEIDVICLPSVIDSESFGVAAVEAMACGKPLIVSDASGFTEVVEDKKCGFIIPKGDLESLVETMKVFYEMTEVELAELGENGVKRVNDLFDFEDNIVTYINAVSQAIKHEV